MFASTTRMNVRGVVLTAGAALALALPAYAGASQQQVASSQGVRSLQIVALGDSIGTSLPLRKSHRIHKQSATVSPNHYQVLRNSF